MTNQQDKSGPGPTNESEQLRTSPQTGLVQSGLKGVDPQLILQRFLDEKESGEQIARSYGVTRAALSLHMIKHADQEWKDAQVAKALRRKEDAEALMDRADNALDLTRAREQLRSAQWDLERVCRRIYGQDQPPQAVAAVQISIGITRKDSQVIDVETIATDDQSVGQKPEPE